MSGNQALNINDGIGGKADLNISVNGSDWYWTVTALMTVSSLAFVGWATTKPRSHRLFHYITASITFIAAIAYFTMASGLGQVPIRAEFFRPDRADVAAAGTREFFYVRYVDWALTTPLLLLDLLLTAGVGWPTILVTLIADEIMIVTGLLSGLTYTTYKWGYFTFGMVAFFFVIYQLGLVGLKSAGALGAAPRRAYLHCGVLTLFIWAFYPLAFGLSEGGNVISPTGEAIFYGILDLIAKPVFGFLLLWNHRKITPAELGLSIRDAETGGTTTTTAATGEKKRGGFFGRKSGHHNGTAPATTTTTGVNNV